MVLFENGPLPIECNVCGSWVQVYGYFWVHVYAFWCMSMARLGACMQLLGACLTVGSFA